MNDLKEVELRVHRRFMELRFSLACCWVLYTDFNNYRTVDMDAYAKHIQTAVAKLTLARLVFRRYKKVSSDDTSIDMLQFELQTMEKLLHTYRKIL